ncbi:hypothetical protein PICSAR15_01628 [Mycobacterium avium subsp. paratuberculosis]|nr:hypothetical protein PICSAR10_03018 [Mycobacterium avium subsp. paratuberculosis]CAG6919126.1 hypothetical protein PICSAR107_03550 [Mycobacterium avium subsp. paratuberculosis]CAG6973799.1 hypothetical protein PICSAR15_01628 [Mycobacterium avium subsp. paratuberculosis]CAG7090576.1 hypothetical protein PICSAR178_03641 [Mycobacterium avium subsp. paratuberculosis]CAG7290978.1 hypothetical protein PICSAR4_03831 [Mycobacterium avium subsp. paratuberculosis]
MMTAQKKSRALRSERGAGIRATSTTVALAAGAGAVRLGLGRGGFPLLG